MKLCYTQEGDEDFLCTTTYDHWDSARQKIAEISDDATPIDRKRQLLPTVTLIAATLNPAVANQNLQINAASSKVKDVTRKFAFDSASNVRAAPTLRIMRACRLFGYTFVASTPLAALQGELVHLNLLPICCQLGHHLLTAELVSTKDWPIRRLSLPL